MFHVCFNRENGLFASTSFSGTLHMFSTKKEENSWYKVAIVAGWFSSALESKLDYRCHTACATFNEHAIVPHTVCVFIDSNKILTISETG